jgi:hypothetical protein
MSCTHAVYVTVPLIKWLSEVTPRGVPLKVTGLLFPAILLTMPDDPLLSTWSRPVRWTPATSRRRRT